MIVISMGGLMGALIGIAIVLAVLQGMKAGAREVRKGLEWVDQRLSPPASFYRMCGFKASEIPTYEKPKANHYPYVVGGPYDPTNAETERIIQQAQRAVQQPVAPNTDPWVTYAMQHPEVKLEMVEKCKVEGDQFVAEKHVKMTGPLPGVVPTPQVPFWRSGFSLGGGGFSLGGDQPRFMPAKTYSKLLENHPDLR